MNKSFFIILLVLFTLICSESAYSKRIAAFQSNEDYKKILRLIEWLKSTYPDSNRTKWDETCKILVEWSLIDSEIDVVVNVDVIEDLLNDEGYKYKVETVRIYTLGVIAYCLQKTSKCNQEDAAYRGLIDVINFYQIIKTNDSTVISKAIESYMQLKKEKKLEDFINNFFNEPLDNSYLESP